MNYNLNLQLEYVRSAFIGQIEVSSVGTAGVRRVNEPTLALALEAFRQHASELVGAVEAYHRPAQAVEAPAPVEVVEPGPKAEDAPAEIVPAAIDPSPEPEVNVTPIKRGPGRPPKARQFAAA